MKEEEIREEAEEREYPHSSLKSSCIELKHKEELIKGELSMVQTGSQMNYYGKIFSLVNSPLDQVLYKNASKKSNFVIL